MKKSGIFIKVFSYTVVTILLLVSVTAALFSQQFMSFYRTMQTREIVASYEPLISRIQGSGYQNIAESAQRFRENNQSFEFHIMDNDGNIIYATPNADTTNSFNGEFYFVVHRDMNISIVAQSRTGLDSFYRDLVIRAIVILAVMLLLCLACAYVFAQKMTRPIKMLADDANKMANLEEVPPPSERKDELGALAHDIYFMYGRLKETISRLEDEILRVREMEEAQRYFFSAASHELKTPIAATSVLLEGMLENVGEYSDHPKYLRECVKMMDAQNDLVSDIMEIVALSDGKILPAPEMLDIGQTVYEILPDYRILAETNRQKIMVDIPDGQSCFADPKMLKKALSNILLNAVQNTPAGGEIRLWSEPIALQYRLYVLNTGIRIDDTVLPKLFDPFYRTDTARTCKSGRSGLGLTIVRKTLETMGVSFALENAPDGVLFWMDLSKPQES